MTESINQSPPIPDLKLEKLNFALVESNGALGNYSCLTYSLWQLILLHALFDLNIINGLTVVIIDSFLASKKSSIEKLKNTLQTAIIVFA